MGKRLERHIPLPENFAYAGLHVCEFIIEANEFTTLQVVKQ